MAAETPHAGPFRDRRPYGTAVLSATCPGFPKDGLRGEHSFPEKKRRSRDSAKKLRVALGQQAHPAVSRRKSIAAPPPSALPTMGVRGRLSPPRNAFFSHFPPGGGWGGAPPAFSLFLPFLSPGCHGQGIKKGSFFRRSLVRYPKSGRQISQFMGMMDSLGKTVSRRSITISTNRKGSRFLTRAGSLRLPMPHTT